MLPNSMVLVQYHVFHNILAWNVMAYVLVRIGSGVERQGRIKTPLYIFTIILPNQHY